MALMIRPISNRSLYILCVLLFFGSSELLSQRKPRIRGNRKVTEVSESLPPFRHITLQDNLEVRLDPSGTEGYQLRADENLVDILRFEVRDSTLYIGSFYRITGSKSLEITVSFSELRRVAATAGHLYNTAPFQSEVLDLLASEDARLSLEYRAGLSQVMLEGNSRATLRAEADSLSVDMRERSDAFIYTVNQGMQLYLREQSGLDLEGISAQAAFEATDNSGLDATRLEAESLRLKASASATARVRATTQLELDASGGSRTYLYGSPAITVLQFSERSELHKEED